MKNFSDKTKAIIALQERGYDQDFVLKEEYIQCAQCSKCIETDDFEIDRTWLEIGIKEPLFYPMILASFDVR